MKYIVIFRYANPKYSDRVFIMNKLYEYGSEYAQLFNSYDEAEDVAESHPMIISGQWIYDISTAPE